MSQIGCRCGAQISDTTDFNPAKARFVRDVDIEATEEALIARWTGYLRSVLDGKSQEWLIHAGYNAEYVALGLSHEQVIGDMLNRSQAELFECGNCGRLLFETSPNRFDFYLPEDGKRLGVFRSPDSTD